MLPSLEMLYDDDLAEEEAAAGAGTSIESARVSVDSRPCRSCKLVQSRHVLYQQHTSGSAARPRDTV